MSFVSRSLSAVRRLLHTRGSRGAFSHSTFVPRDCLKAVAAVTGPLFVTDRGGSLLWASDAAVALLARTGHDALPPSLASLMHPDDWRGLQADLASGAATIAGRWRWGCEAGWRVVEGRLVDAGDSTAPGGVLLAVTDVTELEEDAARYRQAMKLDTIGLMAGGLAHDFNNLLASIRLNAELLEMERDEPVSELAEIQRTVERGAVLCRRLLSIARSDVGDPRAVGLADLMREALPMLRSAISAGVEIVIEGSPARVVADRVQMEMVLLNLAVNASDAMSGEGRLTLSCECVRVVEGDAHAQAGIPLGAWVVLTASDTGPGIPPDVINRIFEPFFTTKPAGKGTGLGLATVFRIATEHSGHVRVTNNPRAGACFRVYLPSWSAPDMMQQPEAPAAGAEHRGTVLVAEDDYALRFAVVRIFGRSGWQVLDARDGAEAQQLLEQRAWDIDLVVTDIEMPGKDGVQLLEALSLRRPGVPVIIMSGRSLERAQALVQEHGWAGNRRFLQKPLALGDLLAAAAELTAEKHG